MSFVEKYGPELPYLRRYARALTGNQQKGDDSVRYVLNQLAQNPDLIDSRIAPKPALFSLFHRLYRDAGAWAADSEVLQDAPDYRLSHLAPVQRQAFLLSAVEGFSETQLADILDVPVEQVRDLLDQAQSEIETQLRTRVMIIEDELIIATELEAIVQDLGHEVTGIAMTHKEATQLVHRDPPGIVLCDVQLADNSSGIEAAEEILSQYDVPLIFITAFPERLLTGNKPEPAYLITKPFQPNTVKAIIGQALFFHQAEADPLSRN